MEYQTLYRKWRPQTFNEVIGQGHIINTLKNELKSSRLKHAYLFCGTRGTGKTTIARLLARAVNCTNPQDANPCNECEICRGILDGSIIDVIEFDAASNSRVEDMRGILDEVIYSPSKAKYKVYIIDEVHMLSASAFNALLKTLEEPPEHVIFILATTEVQKIPQTILSRCQRFDFRRVSMRDLEIYFRTILHAEGAVCDDASLEYVCAAADGSIRDGLSILDKVLSSCGKEIHYEDVCQRLGVASEDTLAAMADAILWQNAGSALDTIHGVFESGANLELFVTNMIAYFRDIAVVQSCSNYADILEYSTRKLEKLRSFAKGFSPDRVLYAVDTLSKAAADGKYAKNPSILYEVAFLKITRAELDDSREALLARIGAIEEQIKNGRIAVELSAPVRETQPPASAPIARSQPKAADLAAKIPEPPKTEPVREETQAPALKSKKAVPPPPPKEEPIRQEATAPAGTGQAVRLDWNAFQKQVRKKDMALAAPLMETQGILDGKGTLFVVFRDEDAFLKMIVSSPSNLETIKELMKELFGCEVSVRTELQADFNRLGISAPEQPAAPAASEPARETETPRINKTPEMKELDIPLPTEADAPPTEFASLEGLIPPEEAPPWEGSQPWEGNLPWEDSQSWESNLPWEGNQPRGDNQPRGKSNPPRAAAAGMAPVTPEEKIARLKQQFPEIIEENE